MTLFLWYMAALAFDKICLTLSNGKISIYIFIISRQLNFQLKIFILCYKIWYFVNVVVFLNVFCEMIGIEVLQIKCTLENKWNDRGKYYTNMDLWWGQYGVLCIWGNNIDRGKARVHKIHIAQHHRSIFALLYFKCWWFKPIGLWIQILLDSP